MRIRELSPTDTEPLRRSVLRDGTPSDVTVWDGDDDATTFHLGVCLDDGTIVAISTWLERAHPTFEGRPAVQVRGMATTPAHRGIGLGSILLDSGLAVCRQRGIEVVWARARVTALTFYERRGFHTLGERYIDPTTELSHVDIATELTAA